MIEPEATDAFRLIHGASDGWPGWYVERLGRLLAVARRSDSLERRSSGRQLRMTHASTGVLPQNPVASRPPDDAGRSLAATVFRARPAPERFSIRENGVKFELSFTEGYSVGLFLDQRDNRRRFLTGHIAADFESPDSEDAQTAKS